MLALHQVEHAVDGDAGRRAEVLVEAEGQPGTVDPGDRPLQLEIVSNLQRHLRLDRRLDRRARHLAVALGSVAVPGGEAGAVDRDRQIQRRPGDELLAVDVAAAPARRDRRVHARLVRRHAEHAEERRQADGAPGNTARIAVQLPVEPVALAAAGDAPRAGHDLVDPNCEHLPDASAAHLDRAGERVARVELRVPRLERLVTTDVPAGVRSREADGVPWVDGEHGLELEREVPVQDRRVERQLVAH